MAEENSDIANMCAITISREYGSGGGEVAARLAHRLEWQLIDHEVVVRVAQKLRISEEEAEENDERIDSPLSRFLETLQVIQPTLPLAVNIPTMPNVQVFYKALTQVIDGVIAKGHVVIVGRGAQAQLAKRRDILHARIVAPIEARIAYVMGREGLDREAAHERIMQKDAERARYLEMFYHCRPYDAHLYDVVVNTGVLDLDSVVETIYFVLERKASKVRVSTQELGPVIGLERYPAQPKDFRPPQNATQP